MNRNISKWHIREMSLSKDAKWHSLDEEVELHQPLLLAHGPFYLGGSFYWTGKPK